MLLMLLAVAVSDVVVAGTICFLHSQLPFPANCMKTLRQGLWFVMCMTDVTNSPPVEHTGGGYNFLNGLGLEAMV